jgi:hypothetical protein
VTKATVHLSVMLLLVPSAAASAAESDPHAPRFVALPAIDATKNEGTDYGLLGVFLPRDASGTLNTLIAVNLSYRKNVGVNGFADYRSRPSPHSFVDLYGFKAQRVEQKLEAHYEDSALRDGAFRVYAELHQHRVGADRFFGRGDDTSSNAESALTRGEYLADLRAGPNLRPGTAVLGTLRFRRFRLGKSVLDHLPDVRDAYPLEPGIHGGKVAAAGVRAVVDRREREATPETGSYAEGYAEVARFSDAGEDGWLRRFGLEGRKLWPVGKGRWLVTVLRGRAQFVLGDAVPFWELSSLGGEESLRAYGEHRFTDRHSVLGGVEARFRVAEPRILGQPIALQAAPFLEAGKVFDDVREELLGRGLVQAVHRSWGLGLRGVVEPYIVGRLDLAWGSEGLAITTGIGYTF